MSSGVALDFIQEFADFLGVNRDKSKPICRSEELFRQQLQDALTQWRFLAFFLGRPRVLLAFVFKKLLDSLCIKAILLARITPRAPTSSTNLWGDAARVSHFFHALEPATTGGCVLFRMNHTGKLEEQIKTLESMLRNLLPDAMQLVANANGARLVSSHEPICGEKAWKALAAARGALEIAKFEAKKKKTRFFKNIVFINVFINIVYKHCANHVHDVHEKRCGGPKGDEVQDRPTSNGNEEASTKNQTEQVSNTGNTHTHLPRLSVVSSKDTATSRPAKERRTAPKCLCQNRSENQERDIQYTL